MLDPSKLKQGDAIFANGYPGAFVRKYSDGMSEVRLPGGVACIPNCDGQPIDPQPGAYYVSVVDGRRVGKLAGPFDKHVEALQLVAKTRELAEEMDPRAHWYAFGTIRLPNDDSVPIRAGLLNKQLGLPA